LERVIRKPETPVIIKSEEIEEKIPDSETVEKVARKKLSDVNKPIEEERVAQANVLEMKKTIEDLEKQKISDIVTQQINDVVEKKLAEMQKTMEDIKVVDDDSKKIEEDDQEKIAGIQKVVKTLGGSEVADSNRPGMDAADQNMKKIEENLVENRPEMGAGAEKITGIKNIVEEDRVMPGMSTTDQKITEMKQIAEDSERNRPGVGTADQRITDMKTIVEDLDGNAIVEPRYGKDRLREEDSKVKLLEKLKENLVESDEGESKPLEAVLEVAVCTTCGPTLLKEESRTISVVAKPADKSDIII